MLQCQPFRQKNFDSSIVGKYLRRKLSIHVYFFADKARERVALEKGVTAYEEIKLEANEALINKSLGVKIQNLRKARRYAQNRNNNNNK